MAQTNYGWRLSLSLSAENWAETKEQSAARSALSSASCQRSGRSPALPYPLHDWLEFTISDFPPLAKGTFLLWLDRARFPEQDSQ
jgi:hypothetical protein